MVGYAFYKDQEYGLILNANSINKITANNKGEINLSIFLRKDFINRIAEKSPSCVVKKSEQSNDTSSLVNITISKDWLNKLAKKEIIKSSLDANAIYVDANGNILQKENYIELNRIFINIKDGKVFPTPSHYKGQDIPNISATVQNANDFDRVAEYCRKETINNLYGFSLAGDNLVRMPKVEKPKKQRTSHKL